MKRFIFVFIVCLVLASVSMSQEMWTKNTIKLTAGQNGGAASIADMAWLAGTWRGAGLGGSNEEIWSAPQGGVMMGSYRMLKDSKPVFYEFLTLSETDGRLKLRIKHFGADLVGWEEKDKTEDMAFIKRDGNRHYFHGLTWEVLGPNKVNIYLAIEGKDKVTEETFRYERVK
jgi:hypothetical protein